MKTALIFVGIFGVLALAAIFLHLIPDSHGSHLLHGGPKQGSESITIPLNEPGFARCGQPFFDSVYELTKAVFAVGADKVVLSDYENQMFDLIRNSEEFKDNPEPFIDHIKAIPGQTIEIVNEDPKVLDTCKNFQVAMVGPE
jgi:hypothetical protein